jgi:hypothetical protein
MNNKWILPLVIALLTGLVGGVSTTLYKHELAVLKNARHIERLQVKDYRQHRDSLRTTVRIVTDLTNQLEIVLDMDPDAFGPNGRLIVKTRKAQLEHAIRRLENDVEENKHSGRED